MLIEAVGKATAGPGTTRTSVRTSSSGACAGSGGEPDPRHVDLPLEPRAPPRGRVGRRPRRGGAAAVDRPVRGGRGLGARDPPRTTARGPAARPGGQGGPRLGGAGAPDRAPRTGGVLGPRAAGVRRARLRALRPGVAASDVGSHLLLGDVAPDLGSGIAPLGFRAEMRIPGLGELPVRLFFLLILAFAILVGPVAYVTLRRRQAADQDALVRTDDRARLRGRDPALRAALRGAGHEGRRALAHRARPAVPRGVRGALTHALRGREPVRVSACRRTPSSTWPLRAAAARRERGRPSGSIWTRAGAGRATSSPPARRPDPDRHPGPRARAPSIPPRVRRHLRGARRGGLPAGRRRERPPPPRARRDLARPRAAGASPHAALGRGRRRDGSNVSRGRSRRP